jgi:predicted nuclease with TOPRIM domain
MQEALPYALVALFVGGFFYIKLYYNKLKLAQKIKEDSELTKKQETLSQDINDLKEKIKQTNIENPEDFWRKN